MNPKLHRILAAALLILLLAADLEANNIQVSNVKLTGQNTTNDYTMVQFDLAWENSWRTSSAPNNRDAAWVFVKYRINGGEWQHAWLNNTGHTGTGATIDAGLLTPGDAFDPNTNPALGAFIYRSADGTGTFAITGAQLRWNYGANGLADGAYLEVKVFAIEMVYVPEGDFSVGTGANPAESASFTQANNTTGATIPFLITSTPPTIQGNNTGSSPSNLGARGAMDLSGTATASLATEFPTGYAAFYCMKYEINQQQYVDFLNTLTQTQANNRKSTVSAFRYAITGTAVGGYATTNPYVACNHLSWMDGAAYADWAGLRPMTELEFEKACRGTAAPVANEYAWGNTSAIAPTGISNPGANNETASNSGANAVYYYTDASGPLRVGVFATGNSDRVTAGASYYGIMELSGNLWERSVTVGNVAGRSYTGIHGNGALNSAGAADEDHWPGINGNSSTTTQNGMYSGTTGVTQAAGSGFRGGFWNFSATYMCVSNRSYAAWSATYDDSSVDFRAVRVP